MPDLSGVGKMIVMIGVGLVILGGLLTVLGKWSHSSGGALHWLGRLPGDIFVKRDNFTFYFPLSTSLLISIVGSALFYFLFRR